MWFPLLCRACVGICYVAAGRWVTVGVVPVVRWGGDTSLLPVCRDEEWGLELALGVEWKAPCRYAREHTHMSNFFVIIDDVGALCRR